MSDRSKAPCFACAKLVKHHEESGLPWRHDVADDYVGPISGDGRTCCASVPSLVHLVADRRQYEGEVNMDGSRAHRPVS